MKKTIHDINDLKLITLDALRPGDWIYFQFGSVYNIFYIRAHNKNTKTLLICSEEWLSNHPFPLAYDWKFYNRKPIYFICNTPKRTKKWYDFLFFNIHPYGKCLYKISQQVQDQISIA